jgi:hypothetical protein
MRRGCCRTPVQSRWAVMGLAVALAGVALLGPAVAQEATSHPVDSAMEFMNLKATPGTMPDFVRQSRRDLTHEGFIAAGQKPPSRDQKMKTPAEVSALTAELDAARAAQVAGKRPAPPSTGKAQAAKAVRPSKPVLKAVQATNH